MYIQPSREESDDLAIPRGYSGNAFRRPTSDPPPPPPAVEQPPAKESPPDKIPEPLPPDPSNAGEIRPEAEEAVPTATSTEEKKDRQESGFLSRFPFLSSLLPPKRSKKRDSALPEWVLIAAVFFLFFTEEEENDILPFLLLLLFWD
ncbi:MAG: hypothetical protein E7585_03840 [Ruminococcaceae bacterium]|nr:hypothetical protein [Oscillospiraceae bacterium]